VFAAMKTPFLLRQGAFVLGEFLTASFRAYAFKCAVREVEAETKQLCLHYQGADPKWRPVFAAYRSSDDELVRLRRRLPIDTEGRAANLGKRCEQKLADGQGVAQCLERLVL